MDTSRCPSAVRPGAGAGYPVCREVLLWLLLATLTPQIPLFFQWTTAACAQEQLSRPGFTSPLKGDMAEQARILQSSVDSVALSLGGIFRTMPTADARLMALATALNSLTFEQGGDVYFTAWNGTRIVHSPLTPDLHNTDFSQATDGSGNAFVQEMERVAQSGGGFIVVTLPRQRLACPVQKLSLPSFALGNDSVFFRLYGLRLYAAHASAMQTPGRPGVVGPETAISSSLMQPGSRADFLSGLQTQESEAVQTPQGRTKKLIGAVASSRPADTSDLPESSVAAGVTPSAQGAASGQGNVGSVLSPVMDRGLSAQEWAPWSWKENPAAPGEGQAVSALLPPPAVLEAEPVRQILYVRVIPGSDWHIAAFMPLGQMEGAKSEIVPLNEEHVGPVDQAAKGYAMRTGLFLTGFALLGLLGVLGFTLVWRRRGGA